MSLSSSGKTTSQPASAPVVLIVDDEETTVQSLTSLFADTGADVASVSSADDALKMLKDRPVLAVISEMHIGDTDGADLMATVAEQSPDALRIMLTAEQDAASVMKAINTGKTHLYLTKPWDDGELLSALDEKLRNQSLERRNRGLEEQLLKRNSDLAELNASLEKRVADRTEELRLHARLIEHAFSDLQKSYGHVLRLASSLAVLRDPKGIEIATLRAQMAASLAEASGLGSQDVNSIRDAALLADLGTIGLPDELLQKPFNQFDGDDTRLFSQSPVLAEAALMGIPGMRQTAAYLRHQYERYDGSGYPDNVAGDNIPLGSRIIAIVRDYSDILRGRFNGQELSKAKARAMMLNRLATRYDPGLLCVFCEQCGAFATEKLAADEARISVSELEPGMVLAGDLYSERGMILLTQGHELNDELIGKLRDLQICTGRELDVRVVREESGLLEAEA